MGHVFVPGCSRILRKICPVTRWERGRGAPDALWNYILHLEALHSCNGDDRELWAWDPSPPWGLVVLSMFATVGVPSAFERPVRTEN